jgi:hypothetical protein
MISPSEDWIEEKVDITNPPALNTNKKKKRNVGEVN